MSVGSGSPKQTVIYFLWAMKLAVLVIGYLLVTLARLKTQEG